MTVTNQRLNQNTVHYIFSGVLDSKDAHQFFDINFADYYEIGDAIGAILDFRHSKRTMLTALRTAQNRSKGVVFNTPVAVLGKPGSLLMYFLTTLDALSSKGKSRFAFLSSVEEAEKWIEDWFLANNLERSALVGQITATIPEPILKPTG